MKRVTLFKSAWHFFFIVIVLFKCIINHFFILIHYRPATYVYLNIYVCMYIVYIIIIILCLYKLLNIFVTKIITYRAYLTWYMYLIAITYYTLYNHRKFIYKVNTR